jgi:hypothetical protein
VTRLAHGERDHLVAALPDPGSCERHAESIENGAFGDVDDIRRKIMKARFADKSDKGYNRVDVLAVADHF